MITIYGLTNAGISVARNPRNPNDLKHQIIAYLYRVDRATLDQIARYLGVTPLLVSITIRRQLKGLVGAER